MHKCLYQIQKNNCVNILLMKRRKFIARSSSIIPGIPFFKKVFDNSLNSLVDNGDIKEYLSKILYTKEEVDGWFSGRLFPFVAVRGMRKVRPVAGWNDVTTSAPYTSRILSGVSTCAGVPCCMSAPRSGWS